MHNPAQRAIAQFPYQDMCAQNMCTVLLRAELDVRLSRARRQFRRVFSALQNALAAQAEMRLVEALSIWLSRVTAN